eukprot:1173193-Alexandrium_andersonii.AAC.1
MLHRAHARVSLTACQSAPLSLRVAQTPPLPPLMSHRRRLSLRRGRGRRQLSQPAGGPCRRVVRRCSGE